MAKKSKSVFHKPWSLFALATILLSAGWLMKSFPVLIFVGFAPLFAIADQAKDHTSPWNHFELILLALAVSLFVACLFDFSQLVVVLALAILFTFAFVGYSFAYQNLGNRLGKFTVIFFWLALEYILLKLPWAERTTFLADALQLQPTWLRWTYHTGYLGTSVWILSVNLLFYAAFFHTDRINPYLFGLAILLIAIPVMVSYQLETVAVSREQMMSLYSQASPAQSTVYGGRGELVARTSAWLSALIILLSFVKNKTRKK